MPLGCQWLELQWPCSCHPYHGRSTCRHLITLILGGEPHAWELWLQGSQLEEQPLRGLRLLVPHEPWAASYPGLQKKRRCLFTWTVLISNCWQWVLSGFSE